MTTTPSPIEQFIQNLEELERTMTRGPWEEREVMGQRFIAAPDPRPDAAYGIEILCDDDTNYPTKDADIAGIAHLKNSNPTVIEMLKAAIEGLKRVVNGDHSGTRSRESHHAVQTLAHLNTLAASALGTTGAKDE